jgi:hypothetical protein
MGIHGTNTKCDSCGYRHTPNDKDECISLIMSDRESLELDVRDKDAEIASLRDRIDSLEAAGDRMANKLDKLRGAFGPGQSAIISAFISDWETAQAAGGERGETMTDKHSPLPWKADSYDDTETNRPFSTAQGMYVGDCLDVSDRAMILHRVNNWDAVVGALRNCLNMANSSSNTDQILSETVRIECEQALEIAEGKE